MDMEMDHGFSERRWGYAPEISEIGNQEVLVLPDEGIRSSGHGFLTFGVWFFLVGTAE